MGPMAFLTPLQVARSFGEEVWRLSAIEVGFSLGMMLGGMLIAWWGGFPNKVHSMVLANLTFGLCTVVLGIPPAFGIYVLLMGVVGVVVPMFNTPATVLLQEKVEDAFLGRIFGVNTMIASSLMPLSMLVYGPLADVIRRVAASCHRHSARTPKACSCWPTGRFGEPGSPSSLLRARSGLIRPLHLCRHKTEAHVIRPPTVVGIVKLGLAPVNDILEKLLPLRLGNGF